MNNKFKLRRLFIFAFALALYATKVGTAHLTGSPQLVKSPEPVQVAQPADSDAVVVIPDPAAPQIPEFQDATEDEPVISNQYLQESTVLPGELSPAQETLAIYGGRKIIRRYPKPAAKNLKAPETEVASDEESTIDEDPTAALERFYGGSQLIKKRYLEVMGVKVDLTEIDLLVETEIAAGVLKSRKDILTFRREAVAKKAQELRDALRSPSSVKKSSL